MSVRTIALAAAICVALSNPALAGGGGDGGGDEDQWGVRDPTWDPLENKPDESWPWRRLLEDEKSEKMEDWKQNRERVDARPSNVAGDRADDFRTNPPVEDYVRKFGW